MEQTRPTSALAASPMAMAEARLRWLEQRQGVLSRNVANADTPRFRPSDLAPFAQVLARGAAQPSLARTDPGHLAPRGGGVRALADRRPAEEAPDGNAVALDEQALKIADTETAHALATGLYRRYVAQFRTALGRGG